MNTSLVRWIDRIIGVPCCFAVSLLLRMAHAVAAFGDSKEPPRKILFLKPAEQGATVLAVPAFEEAAARLGAENVHVMVFQRNREIVDLLGIIPSGNVLTIRDSGLAVFVIDMLRFLWRARSLQIDTTVDLEFFARFTALLAVMTGARIRVGLHRFAGEGVYRGDLMTHRIQFSPYLSTAELYLSMARAAWEHDCSPPMLKAPAERVLESRRPPRFQPPPEETHKVQCLLAGLPGFPEGAFADRRLVLFNPKFADELPVRKWPVEAYEELAGMLLDRYGDVLVLVIGLKCEAEAAAAFCQRLDKNRVFNLAGRLSLRELVVLCGMAEAIVGSDSGPAHFAALTDCHAHVLFGPETPVLFRPLTPNATVYYRPTACSPCFNAYNNRVSTCTRNACMENIPVREVFDGMVCQLG